MSNTTREVFVGKPQAAGVVWYRRAMPGLVLPTDAYSPIPEGFVSPGYVSSDGTTVTPDRSSDKTYAWGGDQIATLQTEYGLSVQFAMAQTLNRTANEIAFGHDNVEFTPADSERGNRLAVKLNKNELDFGAYIVDMINKGGARVRYCFGNATPSGMDDITYNDETVTVYAMTLDCLPDEDGNAGYRYSDDGFVALGPSVPIGAPAVPAITSD